MSHPPPSPACTPDQCLIVKYGKVPTGIRKITDIPGVTPSQVSRARRAGGLAKKNGGAHGAVCLLCL